MLDTGRLVDRRDRTLAVGHYLLTQGHHRAGGPFAGTHAVSVAGRLVQSQEDVLLGVAKVVEGTIALCHVIAQSRRGPTTVVRGLQ